MYLKVIFKACSQQDLYPYLLDVAEIREEELKMIPSFSEMHSPRQEEEQVWEENN